MRKMSSVTQKTGNVTSIHYRVGQCSYGFLLAAFSPLGLCAVLLGDDPDVLVRDLRDRFQGAEIFEGDMDFHQQAQMVIDRVEEPTKRYDLPLDCRGTDFQKQVWQALQGIPLGKTATYAEIAQRIGNPQAVRAVAQACSANSIAVIIPCHRVVRTDGSLSGYRWGVERKAELLKREQGYDSSGSPKEDRTPISWMRTKCPNH